MAGGVFQPMSVDGELLVTAVFLPLNLCLAMGRGVLQWTAEQYVSVFPPLREAARGQHSHDILCTLSSRVHVSYHIPNSLWFMCCYVLDPFI